MSKWKGIAGSSPAPCAQVGDGAPLAVRLHAHEPVAEPLTAVARWGLSACCRRRSSAARMRCPGNGVRAIQQRGNGPRGSAPAPWPNTPQHGAEWGRRDQHLAGCHSVVTATEASRTPHMPAAVPATLHQVGGAERQHGCIQRSPLVDDPMTATRTPSGGGRRCRTGR